MELKPGYKLTEVGVIPEDWETRTCSELSERIMVGIVIRPTQYYVSQGVPAFRSANIREDGITDTDLVFISQASNSLLAKSQTRVGDVLTVRTGYPGTSAVVRDAHAGCNCIDIIITRPSKKLHSDYLALWVNSFFGKEQVLRNQGGLAQKHFNVGDMKNLVVAMPSLLEQRAIATALSDVDALLEALDRLIAKKRDLKQAAMQQLLTGQTRLPGFHGQWELKRLGEVIDFANGKPHEDDIDSTGEFYLITLDSIGIDGKLKGEHRPIGFCDGSLAKDDIVTILSDIAHGNLLGLCDLIPEDNRYVLNQRVGRLRVKPDIKASPAFLRLQINRHQEHFKKRGQGTSQRHIYRRDFDCLELNLPTNREQTAIAEVLSEMDAEIAALEQRREKTRVLKQGMMQELLTGRIRLV